MGIMATIRYACFYIVAFAVIIVQAFFMQALWAYGITARDIALCGIWAISLVITTIILSVGVLFLREIEEVTRETLGLLLISAAITVVFIGMAIVNFSIDPTEVFDIYEAGYAHAVWLYGIVF